MSSQIHKNFACAFRITVLIRTTVLNDGSDVREPATYWLPKPADQKRDPTVETVTEIFWRKGFEETSMAEIVAATGLNRYAIYTAYGGKLDLFLASIDYYHARHRDLFLRTLADPARSPLDAIREVFLFSIEEMATRKTGCLLCNVAPELAGTEPIVRERITLYLAEIEKAFTEALRRAETAGMLNPHIAIADSALVLVNLIMGLGTHARNGADKNTLLRIFNAVMATTSHPDMMTNDLDKEDSSK